MSFHSRLTALERQVVATVEYDVFLDQWREESERRLAEMLAHIPTDLRDAIEAAFTDPDDSDTRHTISNWMSAPFARWAGPIPEGFVFPESLVIFLLNPPRRIWIGHHCKVCRLTVPIYLTWTNGPDPPKNLTIFATCPACGGITGCEV